MKLDEGKSEKTNLNLGNPVQIGWVVTNLGKAMKSFERIFNINEWRTTRWPDPALPEIESRHRGQPAPDWQARMAFASVGDGLTHSAAAIELVENLAGQSTYSEWLQKRGPGIHHFMYVVNDVESIISEFKVCGIKVLTCCGTRQEGKFNTRWAAFDTEKLIGINTEIISSDGIRQ